MCGRLQPERRRRIGLAPTGAGFIPARKSLSKRHCTAGAVFSACVPATLGPLLVDTRLRPPPALGPDRIIRLGSEAGFAGISVSADVSEDLLKLLATEGMRANLPVQAVACPLSAAPLPKGKRLPHLLALDDPEERRAAMKRARETMAFAHPLGVGLYLLDLGPVPLKTPAAPLRLGYARREMDVGEPGARALRRALDERKARGGAILDAIRAGLESILGEADRRGTTVLLGMAASPWQAPTPKETEQVLGEFRGAPLRLVDAGARRAILGDLGLLGPPEVAAARRLAFAGRTGFVEIADRVGLDDGYCATTGDFEPAAPDGIPRNAAWMVTGPLDTVFADVLRAKTRAVELRAKVERAAEAADRSAEGDNVSADR